LYRASANQHNFLSNLLVAFFLFIFFYFLSALMVTRNKINDLPDLSELEFLLISDSLKNNAEILSKYEEIYLGRNAISWIGTKCAKLSKKAEYLNNELSYIRSTISELDSRNNIIQKDLTLLDSDIKHIKEKINRYKQEFDNTIKCIEDLNLPYSDSDKITKILETDVSSKIKEIDKTVLEIANERLKIVLK